MQMTRSAHAIGVCAVHASLAHLPEPAVGRIWDFVKKNPPADDSAAP